MEWICQQAALRNLAVAFRISCNLDTLCCVKYCVGKLLVPRERSFSQTLKQIPTLSPCFLLLLLDLDTSDALALVRHRKSEDHIKVWGGKGD